MSAEPALHSPEAHEAITAELVACTLGQRHRPELRTDQSFARAIAAMGKVLADAFRPYVQAFEALALAQRAVRGEGIEPPTRAV